MTRFILGAVAYLVPTFVLGFVWHLILFENYYEALRIYRSDIIIPLGLLSMMIQAIIFSWFYLRAFGSQNGSFWSRTLTYGAAGAVLSWSFTTLAVAAKNTMASVPNYLLIETAFTAAQWLMVAPLTGLVIPRQINSEKQARSPVGSATA